MTLKTTKLRDAITFALVAGATAAAGTGVAFAQEESSEQQQTTTLDRIEVTGSRIRRAEIEGPAPITVISREDLDVSGELSVADFLRSNIYNTVGSARESSGSATGSFASFNLRGLGSVYTLVLIDGRRMTSSPTQGGAAQNINLLPMAAVERIEILREGAGAVYGSDAIGGVVNVILRKDFEGVILSGGVERPSGAGPDAENLAMTAGISSDRGNVTMTLDRQNRDLMYNRDIRGMVPDAWWNAGLSAFTPAANLLTAGGILPAPNCDSYDGHEIIAGTTYCGFDHGATSANEASLRRDSLMVNGNYHITDNTSAFFRAISSETNSLGVYASAPVDTFPTIAADNPINPHGVEGTLYYRFTPLGTRDAMRRDTYRDLNVGLQGVNDWFGGADWQVGVNYGRVRQSSVNYNYGIGSILQDLIDSGDFNPFDPNHPSVAANAGAIGHTVFVESDQRTSGVDANIAFDLFDTANGAVSFVAGAEYREDRLIQNYDAQSAAGNVFGSAGAGTGGERTYSAAYIETLVPLLSNLTLTAAGRYDDYSDYGGKFSPRVALEFRPLEELLIRGSWGQGFRAPALSDVAGAPGTTNLNAPPTSASSPIHAGGDELACAALQEARAATGNATYQPYPVNPCSSSGQYQWLAVPNADLTHEESENWGVGLVWSPTDNISMALDYYSVEITDFITSLPRGIVFRLGDQGAPGYGVTRGPGIAVPGTSLVLPGAPQQIILPLDNATNKAEGIDFEGSWRIPTNTMGTFSLVGAWSHQRSYTLQLAGSDEVLEFAGLAGRPRNRGQLTVGWDLGDFSFHATGNHIGKSANTGFEATQTLPSWNTVDLQANWNTPWNGRATVGVRNVADKAPPMNNALYGFPFYENELHNIYGRVPYFRYEQRF